LRRPRSVLGPPEAPHVILVVFVDGESAGGGVIEEQVHLELEEVCRAEEHCFFDLGRLSVEGIHRRVKVILGQRLGGGQVDRLAPALPHPELGLRVTQAVSRHREQRPLEAGGILSRREPAAQGGPDPEPFPQGFDPPEEPQPTTAYQGYALGQGAHDRGRVSYRRLAQGVLHLQAADPSDGPAQPYERLTVQPLCAPEGVDDLSHRLAAVGVAYVVRERVVDDCAAIAVFASSGPQVHAHYSRMYHLTCQPEYGTLVCPLVREPSTFVETITP
jgi:hypothetical protein